MQYQKKVILLKQVSQLVPDKKPLSAIARTETEAGVSTFFLSVLNARAKTSGSYYAFLLDSAGKLFSFDVGPRPTSFTKNFDVCPDLSFGAEVGLFFVADNIPELIAFGKSQEFNGDSVTLKKRVAESFLKINKAEAKKPVYDDEAVATVNYYQTEKEDNLNVSIGNGSSCFNCEEKTIENLSCNNGLPYATDLNESSLNFTKPTYYESAREELEEIFLKFEHVEELEKMFPESKFCKINYSEDRYYVVGVIVEEGSEKYICYGVPGKYGEHAPKELEPYCTFIPLSIFNLSGEGFWMMFQDAVTGACFSCKENLK